MIGMENKIKKSSASLSRFHHDQLKLYREIDIVKFINDIRELKVNVKKLDNQINVSYLRELLNRIGILLSIF